VKTDYTDDSNHKLSDLDTVLIRHYTLLSWFWHLFTRNEWDECALILDGYLCQVNEDGRFERWLSINEWKGYKTKTGCKSKVINLPSTLGSTQRAFERLDTPTGYDTENVIAYIFDLPNWQDVDINDLVKKSADKKFEQLFKK